MGRTIVITFVTLDGVIQDPDGSDGTSFGSWAMRHGPDGIAGDKFQLGELMSTGTLLFGRRTWDHFGDLWSPRTTPFAVAMNEATKAVATSRQIDAEHWSNSTAIEGELLPWLEATLSERDVVVIGSISVVRALMDADRVDEYRLLVFPTAAGSGIPLFTEPLKLELISTEQCGPGTLSIYRKDES